MDIKKLSPLVKWAGGKEQELKYIIPALPKEFNNYYEPFVGGGAVYFSLPANKYFINDKSEELIGLYNIIISKDRDSFFGVLDEIIHNWDILANIITNHKDFFIDLYQEYSKEKINDIQLKEDKNYAFILQHTKEFNLYNKICIL